MTQYAQNEDFKTEKVDSEANFQNSSQAPGAADSFQSLPGLRVTRNSGKLNHDSSLVQLQRAGIDPVEEHKRVKQNVRFPLNPAFFNTSLKDRQMLQSMNEYCRTLKVPLNKKQNFEYVTERTKS